MKIWKRLVCLALTLALCLSALPLTASAAGFTRTRTYTPGMFTDIPAGAYYLEPVKDCYELGLINGTSANKFSPNTMYTVGQAVVVAARMHSIYNGGDGTLPASDPYWQSAVEYCVKNGIITKNQFDSYKRNVTRAEMAMLLVAALPASAWTSVNNVAALPDVSSTTDYYRDIFTLYNAGILKGKDDFGTYNPYAAVSRAEVATMIQRCALPEKRVTFTLKPLSQREAPEIIGKLDSYYYNVSNNLMRYVDSKTGLYGYMDASNGKIRIQAQYRDARNFSNGYALVKKESKWGIIDTNGNLTLPMGYNYIDNLNYGVYSARVDYSSRRAIIINGKKATDFVYQSASCNGLYIFGKRGENNWDVMDMDGKLLTNIKAEIVAVDRNYLFRAKSGNKWALASEKGLITDFLYDSIELPKNYNCTLATAKIGNRTALMGLNGEVKDLGLDSGYSFRVFNGDYVLVQKDEMSAIADANGIRSEFVKTTGCGGLRIWGDVLVVSYWSDGDSPKFAYDMSTGKTQTIESSARNGFVLAADGTYFTADGTKCSSVDDLGNGYYGFTTMDGKHGLIHGGRVVSDGIYASEQEAINAYDYHKIVKENGKPVVQMGNDIKGFSNVIHYYKNELYYDEIKEVGEGYYACKYNTTWYLLHA